MIATTPHSRFTSPLFNSHQRGEGIEPSEFRVATERISQSAIRAKLKLSLGVEGIEPSHRASQTSHAIRYVTLPKAGKNKKTAIEISLDGGSNFVRVFALMV